MAIITMERPDVRTDLTNAVRFSMAQDSLGKLVYMLGNSLYSDKEYAVISELCANAYDIHKVTGKGHLPIKVDLPNQLNPEFVVRDYGTGLSYEDVLQFLTAFGASSKTDSNEEIGYWGLGSKSPTAVTDQWSIISYHKGKQTNYEVFVDDTGIPALSKVFEKDTDQVGLEVRVPVRKGNFDVWNKAASKAFKWYDVQPKLNTSILIPKVNITEMGNKWAFASSPNYNYNNNQSKIYVITTLREYELDMNLVSQRVIKDDHVHSFLKSFIERNTQNNLYLFFDVGDIDVSISREQLQYNIKTLNSIVTRLEEVVAHVWNQLERDVKAAEPHDLISYRESLAKLWEKYDFKHLFKMFDDIYDFDNKFNISDIPSGFRQIEIFDTVNEKFTIITSGRTQRILSDTLGSRHYTNARFYRASSDRKKISWQFNAAHLKNYVFVKNDVRNVYARTRHASNSGGYLHKPMIVVNDVSPYANFTCINGSSLPVPPSIDGIKINESVYVWQSYWHKARGKLNKTKLDMFLVENKNALDKVVFIKVKYVRDAYLMCDQRSFSDKLKLLKNYGYIIVFSRNDPPKKQKWLSVEKAAKQMIEVLHDAVKRHNAVEKVAFQQGMQMFNHSLFKQIGFWILNLQPKSKEWKKTVKPFKQFIDYYREHKTTNVEVDRQYKEEVDALSRVASVFELNNPLLNTEIQLDVFNKVRDDLVKRYPLLAMCYSVTLQEGLDNVSNYVDLIDATY
jgi:hypothetical protein